MKRTIKILNEQWVVILMIFTMAFIPSRAFSQSGGGEAYPDLSPNMESLREFSDLKFGMFIHWGPVSLRGTEIGWSRGRDVPIKAYDNLYEEFNPVLFDADAWVKTASDAGMKYIIFTSKHHDGFCMWPSEYTEYDIGSTPFKRDVLLELADACKKYDIKFGLYHSIADWHHPHYTTRYGGDPRPVADSDMGIYHEYLKNQVKELLDRYDPFLIWFDGEWEASWTHEMGMHMYAYLRNLKDDLLINNRVDKGRKGMDGTTLGSQFAGDYATPEQQVGKYDFDNPWETCMTICQQWAWKPNDKMKSLDESLNTLIRTVGGGGNLLYNVGPMLDGRFEQRQVDMLQQMGRWVEEHEEAIYGTRGGPYLPEDDFVSTRKGQSIYIFILNKELKKLSLPIPTAIEIKAVSSLITGKKLEYKITDRHIDITPGSGNGLPRVIELEVDSETNDLEPIDASN